VDFWILVSWLPLDAACFSGYNHGMRVGVARVAIVSVAAAIGAAIVGSAGAAYLSIGHLTATSGEWHASLTYVQKGVGPQSYSDLHLTLLNGGTLVLDVPVVSHLRGSSYLQPGGYGSSKTLSFRDLNGDGVPELLLNLFTGGAHCCSIEQVYDLSGRGPRKWEMSFGDAGATIISTSGGTLFRTADDSFAYEFTDYADSGAPVQLWSYGHNRFTNVTRQYPLLISRDAAFWWRNYRGRLKTHSDVRGILSAWAADEALLGKAAAAKETLLQIAFSGQLDWGFGSPKGSTYVRLLWAFLAKHGYLA
jgi:hypothetical protein